MKSIKSINVGSAVIYSAILAGFWTLVFSVIYWVIGWITGASSAYINMNLGNWTVFTMATFIAAVGRALVAAAVGALAGLVAALVYNLVASMMGGIKIELE
jgi:hypothetical protein